MKKKGNGKKRQVMDMLNSVKAKQRSDNWVDMKLDGIRYIIISESDVYAVV